jgi:hypothetical protein
LEIHGPQRLSPYQATSSRAGTNTADALEFYLSSGEISDADDDDPHFSFTNQQYCFEDGPELLLPGPALSR